MKTVAMMILAITCGATAAQASTTNPRDSVRTKAIAAQACARTDREGFCGLTLIRTTRASATAAAHPNDQSRAELNRLIASLN